MIDQDLETVLLISLTRAYTFSGFLYSAINFIIDFF